MLPGPRMLNQELVKGGSARTYAFPPDVRFAGVFRQEEQQARAAHKGLWGSCSGFDVPVATQQAVSTAAPTALPTHASQVVPDNIDYDCKDFKTQAQAQAYFALQGGSPTNNVDRLDADHDGIACESLP